MSYHSENLSYWSKFVLLWLLPHCFSQSNLQLSTGVQFLYKGVSHCGHKQKLRNQ